MNFLMNRSPLPPRPARRRGAAPHAEGETVRAATGQRINNFCAETPLQFRRSVCLEAVFPRFFPKKTY